MRRRFSTLPLLLAICALALLPAGCGGGDDETSGGNPEAEVTALVEESVVFEDPATICEENFTDELLEENYDGNDREAWVEDCSDDEQGGLAEVEISGVEVKGETATAEVTARNEDDDDATEFTVEIRDEDGWKISGVR
jgi:hypothetical protein